MHAAKMRASRTYQYSSDDALASFLAAFHASLPIRRMLFLEFAFFAMDIPIVGHRVSAKIYASRQGFLDRIEQWPQLILRNILNQFQGMKARAPERFVGIDIADAGDDFLLHQDLLDLAFGPKS